MSWVMVWGREGEGAGMYGVYLQQRMFKISNDLSQDLNSQKLSLRLYSDNRLSSSCFSCT